MSLFWTFQHPPLLCFFFSKAVIVSAAGLLSQDKQIMNFSWPQCGARNTRQTLWQETKLKSKPWKGVAKIWRLAHLHQLRKISSFFNIWVCASIWRKEGYVGAAVGALQFGPPSIKLPGSPNQKLPYTGLNWFTTLWHHQWHLFFWSFSRGDSANIWASINMRSIISWSTYSASVGVCSEEEAGG